VNGASALVLFSGGQDSMCLAGVVHRSTAWRPSYSTTVNATASSPWLARPMPSVPEFEVLIPSFGASHNLSGDAISMIHDF
jgi:hypothetical protein